MPVRVQSWDLKVGLLPIFEMNLPEGALRNRLRRRFAKATGTFDDFDLLAVVGRTQIGRLRYSSLDQGLDEVVPFQSIDEILRARRDGQLFDYLLQEFAVHSGLSGVQPKVMIRAQSGKLSDAGRQSPSVQSATHIVKLWDEDEYPELAANEFFCLQAARRLGLNVPHSVLSDDGGALVVERFDIADGEYLGFEDFCVLNALGTADKYKGGYETRVFRRLREFLPPNDAVPALKALFQLFALNCAIRNGDAHLKNFGLSYAHVDGKASLSPVYDLVTTWAYLPNDPMALTIEGSTKWPNRQALIRLAQTRCDLTRQDAEDILEATAAAVSDVVPDLRRYFASSNVLVGERIEQAWRNGVSESLGAGLRTVRGARVTSSPKIAKSDARLLEYLRENDGSVNATLKAVAETLAIPQSTLSSSIQRLSNKGMVHRTARRITLLPTEV